MEFITLLDNREKAILLWIFLTVAFLLYKKELKQPLWEVVKALSHIKILTPILLMIAYISLLVFLASKVRLWDISMSKDTIIWFFGVGIVMFFNYGKAKENNYLKETILGAVGLTAIVTFLTNIYVFPFLIESLFVIPGLFILGGLLAYSGTQKEYALAHNFLQWVVAIVAVSLFGLSTVVLIGEIQDLSKIRTLLVSDFLLPALLTIGFLPFVYLLALYSRYEQAFLLIGFRLGNDKELASYTKWSLVKSSLFDLRKVDKFIKYYIVELVGIKNKLEIDKIFTKLKIHQKA